MSIARKLLLAASTNAWLRERATKTAFVRRSVSTFMPGERLRDALAAAAAPRGGGGGRATKTAFVRRSGSTFMPGERLEDAMAAAAAQRQGGVGTIFTKLGENL